MEHIAQGLIPLFLSGQQSGPFDVTEAWLKPNEVDQKIKEINKQIAQYHLTSKDPFFYKIKKLEILNSPLSLIRPNRQNHNINTRKRNCYYFIFLRYIDTRVIPKSIGNRNENDVYFDPISLEIVEHNSPRSIYLSHYIVNSKDCVRRILEQGQVEFKDPIDRHDLTVEERTKILCQIEEIFKISSHQFNKCFSATLSEIDSDEILFAGITPEGQYTSAGLEKILETFNARTLPNLDWIVESSLPCSSYNRFIELTLQCPEVVRWIYDLCSNRIENEEKWEEALLFLNLSYQINDQWFITIGETEIGVSLNSALYFFALAMRNLLPQKRHTELDHFIDNCKIALRRQLRMQILSCTSFFYDLEKERLIDKRLHLFEHATGVYLRE